MALYWLWPTSAQGDVFVLTNGGRIQGEWLNRNERPLLSYEVKTAGGGRLTLDKAQVRETIHQRPAEFDYQRIAPTFGNTIQQQWQLAEWCREKQLKTRRAAHLRQILTLDPNHAPARRGLGYAQLNGQWVRQKAWQEDNGYVLYRGSWRTTQEIELLEADEKLKRAQREWLVKLRRHRNALATADNWAEHWKQIQSVRDSRSVPAFAELLKIDPSRNAKILYIETLAEIGSQPAVNLIINTSLNDADVEVFHACADEIVRLKPPGAVEAYIKGLRSANNIRVNRSGHVLGRLGDREAVAPLIEALVTTHLISTPGRKSPPSAMPFNHTFVSPANDAAKQILPAGGSGITFNGDKKPKIIPLVVPNQEVLAALVKLSGGTSFGFNQKAWSNWHAIQKSNAANLSGQD